MTINNNCALSSELIPYLLGEASKDEIDLFEEHLFTCSSCRNEVQEMREAWNLIPFKLDDVEVPSDLKEEVMNAIFQSDRSSEHTVEVKKQKNLTKTGGRIRFSLYGLIAAAFLLSFAGMAWNNIQLRAQLAELKEQTPAEVVRSFTLKSANPSIPSAQGNAWLYKKGNKQELVLQLEGLDATKGTEAYQVWLIHEGNRKSAGTFQVDQDGNGYLTYEFKESDLPFDSIGISLEPDANGTQPRGKKVLGT